MPTKRPAVCIIVENLPLPIDRRVMQEARALHNAGYRVSVICPKGSGFLKARETIEGIEIYRHWLWEASGPLGYPLEYAWALTAEFLLAVRIYAGTRFRIIQACNPPDTIFLVGLFFKLFGVRFIFDHHDLNPELYEAKFRKRDFGYRLVCWAERLTFRTSRVSIATNESYREVAMTRGEMPRERTFVVRSCPDLGRIHIHAPQPGLREGRRNLVVYLGVMGYQDGLDLLLESISSLVRQRDCGDALFVLIGSGPELPRLKQMASQKGLDSFVKFTGRLPDDDVAAYFSTAAFGVAPDRYTPMNDKSTMNKIMEYMAFGLPVVLYDLTEGRRSAGDAALYARCDDSEDFAQKMKTLLENETLRAELGARGRKRILETLNWENERKTYLQAYEAALHD